MLSRHNYVGLHIKTPQRLKLIEDIGYLYMYINNKVNSTFLFYTWEDKNTEARAQLL